VHLKDGRPAPVPRLVCRTREDRLRYAQALLRREVVQHQRAERERLREMLEGMSDEEAGRLLHDEGLGELRARLLHRSGS